MADVKTIKGNRVSSDRQIVKATSKPTFKKAAGPNISDDSEIVGLKSGSKFLKSGSKYGAISSEDEDSFGIGKGGSKFLKKKPKKEPEREPNPEAKKPPISGIFSMFASIIALNLGKMLKEAVIINR